MTGDADLVGSVREALAAAADPEKAAPMQAYMKSAMPFRGIASPDLKALLAPLLAAHPLPDHDAWAGTILELWDGARFREERYAALAVAGHRHHRDHQVPESLDLYEHLVHTGAWWDLVDGTSHLVGGVLRRHPEVRAELEEWAVADDLWVRRSAIICQVGAKDALDRPLLVHAIESNLDGSTRTTPARSPYGREFFVRKAIGWALRDHARTDPDWVRDFVAQHAESLSGLSRREALKHL